MWWVLTGQHKEVTISFLPVIAPDWCFGLLKQRFRRTKIGDLDDIANCVSLSPSVNVPQLVGSLDGTTFVSMYNWSEHFEEQTIKTALKGIINMHHFRFTTSSPGAVFVKLDSSGPERKRTLHGLHLLTIYLHWLSPQDFLQSGSSICLIKSVNFVLQKSMIVYALSHSDRTPMFTFHYFIVASIGKKMWHGMGVGVKLEHLILL